MKVKLYESESHFQIHQKPLSKTLQKPQKHTRSVLGFGVWQGKLV